MMTKKSNMKYSTNIPIRFNAFIPLLLLYLSGLESYISLPVTSYVAKRPKTTTKTHGEKVSLKFVANIRASSNPIENVTVPELGSFLTTKKCRDHLLSAGGTTHCDEVLMTSEFEEMWNNECQEHYGPELVREDRDNLIVSESIVLFPGLKMVNAVYCGVKLLSSNDGVPFYHIILIAEKKNVFGLPPVVWLFNKVTGHSSEKEGIILPPTARVQNIISIKETERGPCFAFDCNAVIQVEFPKTVMKLLPASKEKIEEQGTASVQRAIEKDIRKALENINDVFYEHTKENQQNVLQLIVNS